MAAEIESFLFHEADLLDSHDYAAWLELFTPDATYWIPSGADDTDPSREVSIVYDNAAFLAERVWRLDSGQAYAQQPRSRTAHLIGNIRQVGGTDAAPEVAATFLVVEYRRDTQHQYAGRYRYALRCADGDLRIAHKKVELVNNDGFLGNLSLLL
ncbi:aromatic-ring-hydroxylating dioxygenase subunit beta [Pseudonocardia spinosispora]|uniref:aromatic-ring-hydroxylating dioxygenase subunit beta n=1 Tax=Pseudonocardia spinosispora TaxID=103441 RepID=UPI00040F8959|nr:aromatic-ring-hydroxylating dioxygenase subunit beta [Pseudonocardia spinosispora]